VTPHYSWKIERSKLNISGHEVMQKLADTRPLAIGSLGAGANGMRGRNQDSSAIDTRASYHGSNRDPNTFGFAVWQLKDGEDQLIANRLVEIFSQTPRA
jgi:L-seryl-tRNA(Ser) seleniumtransferase